MYLVYENKIHSFKHIVSFCCDFEKKLCLIFILFGHLKKEDMIMSKKMLNLLDLKIKKNNWKVLWVIVMLSLVFSADEYFTDFFLNRILI